MPFGVAIGVGAAAAVGSAVISSQGAQNAAQTQANAANAASQVQQNQFNQTQANLAPFLGSGVNALAALNRGLGLQTTNPAFINNNSPVTADSLNQLYQSALGRAPTAQEQGGIGQPVSGVYQFLLSSPEGQQRQAQSQSNAPLTKPFTLADFQSSPGYQFQLQQGISAIDNSASARGVSGNTLRDLEAYGTGLANQDYYNAYNVYTNRQNQLFNYLNTLSGSGQNAAAGLGGFGLQTAGQIGNNITGAGNALAAGQIGSANAFGGAFNNLSNIGQLAFLSQQQQPQSFDFTNSLLAANNSPSILAGGGTVAPGTPPF